MSHGAHAQLEAAQHHHTPVQCVKILIAVGTKQEQAFQWVQACIQAVLLQEP